jgi:4-alpha-glucanotransferase
MELKRYANGKGIGIIGDIPYYTAMTAPMYGRGLSFSSLTKTESRSGWPVFRRIISVQPVSSGEIPLYHWKYMEQDGFSWWVKR